MTDRARPTLITPKLALSSLPPLTLPPLAYLASAFCMPFFFFLVLVRLSLSCSLSSFPLPSFVSSFPSPPLASLCCSLVASRSPFPSFPSSPSLPFLLSRCALSSARRLRARRRISRTKGFNFPPPTPLEGNAPCSGLRKGGLLHEHPRQHATKTQCWSSC